MLSGRVENGDVVVQFASSFAKERLAIGFTRELAVYLFSVLIDHPLTVGSVSVLRVLPEVSYSIGIVWSLVVVDCGDLGFCCEVSACLV
jgi:hypothetical protein